MVAQGPKLTISSWLLVQRNPLIYNYSPQTLYPELTYRERANLFWDLWYENRLEPLLFTSTITN